MVEVDAQEVLDSDDVCEAINAAVTAGATAIVLGDARASAAALYEAAVKLKELLRDRAALLLVDRTDIATAVKAEGVLLSDAGAHGCETGMDITHQNGQHQANVSDSVRHVCMAKAVPAATCQRLQRCSDCLCMQLLAPLLVAR